ncbi:MAG TPA: serine/threonine-protein kinase [Polyangiaceae bacterium]|jgi:serine/threonine protein kinase|nr:serine/threonine-protein kinase [Polyangiaceae bacterium]
MTGLPIPQPQAVADAYRARRLSSSDFAEGDVLAEKYRIEAVLGEGGMGIVLRATHIELGCLVAIKVVRPELVHNEDAVLRLLVEARSAASIRSEHVARVLDVGRLESGAPFLVLEHLEGRDLAQILVKSGRLASQVAVDFVLQACQALSEAHSAGIVHRDLKPENLFLSYRADGTPVIKVLDFGISKRVSHDGREAARTNPTQILGSPLYMAPEYMRGGAPADARADIWSLGVVLYELCTGRSPFSGETIPSICARVIGVEPVPPRAVIPDLPAGLEAAILHCLNKDPALRPADIAELAAELAEYGSSDAGAYAHSARIVMTGAGTNPSLDMVSHSDRVPIALSATLPVLAQELPMRRVRRRPMRVGLAAAALACAALAGGAFTLRSGQAHEASLAANPPPVIVTPLPAKTTAPALPSPVSPAPSASASSVVAGSPARKPSAARLSLADGSRDATLKRVPRAGHNPWDPKSFGERL